MIPLMKNALFHETETRQALADFILKTPRLSMGETCREFEIQFSSAQGSRHSVLFNSGSSANLATLQALRNLERLRQGARVGFSALTWATNVMPILQLGMVPVPVDCWVETLNVMAPELHKVLHREEEESGLGLGSGLDAMFITNALGFSGDLSRIRELCHEHDVILLEDNCEALGTELPEGRTGTFGLAATYSFFVAHHMSTIEGGCVCTDDDEVAEMLRIVRANGWDRNLAADQQQRWRTRHSIADEFQAKYTFYDLAYNLRPTEITGFLGIAQLPYLAEIQRRREENYLRLEQQVRENDDLVLLDHSHIVKLSPFAFPVICAPGQRSVYLKRFTDAGIEVRPLIAGNMTRQPFYTKYCSAATSLPGADSLHENGFYCGNYPELTDADLEVIEGCLTNPAASYETKREHGAGSVT